MNATRNNSLLFNCEQSNFISKHRLRDDYEDCDFGIDENQQLDTCSLKLVNRFQFQTECIPRLYLSDSVQDCNDDSDESFFYNSLSFTVEAGCKWKRISLSGHAHFLFFTYAMDLSTLELEI
ncbi:unnamed protein product [Rotaria magnacalcarata]|uniref:Uncharacterized protein n=1 Tax=Rotaria magnacalcarata TaxID=392030 RepID=A0A816F9T4_9BILA|nr:unnamed protein product [Rotaria magnacalcarata]CAF4833040.1 unnamed protein product [Rotaria magnacalcarata]